MESLSKTGACPYCRGVAIDVSSSAPLTATCRACGAGFESVAEATEKLLERGVGPDAVRDLLQHEAVYTAPCPICGARLQTIRVRGEPVHACASCRGFWLGSASTAPQVAASRGAPLEPAASLGATLVSGLSASEAPANKDVAAALLSSGGAIRDYTSVGNILKLVAGLCVVAALVAVYLGVTKKRGWALYPLEDRWSVRLPKPPTEERVWLTVGNEQIAATRLALEAHPTSFLAYGAELPSHFHAMRGDEREGFLRALVRSITGPVVKVEPGQYSMSDGLKYQIVGFDSPNVTKVGYGRAYWSESHLFVLLALAKSQFYATSSTAGQFLESLTAAAERPPQ